MNNVVALQPEKPIDLSASQLKLIKNTVAKGCNDSEFNLFITVCRRIGLDPFRRQIHAIIYNANKPDKRSMTLITSIDGFRAIAARSGRYRPDEDEPDVTQNKELISPSNPKGIEKIVVKAWKLGEDDKWHKLSGVAYWDEFAPIVDGFDEIDKGETWQDGNKKLTRVPNGKDMLDPKNKFWVKMPRLMLAKCAESQALRKGWPEDLSDIYSPEEMHQADTQLASEALEELEVQERLTRINSNDSLFIQWKTTDEIVGVPTGQFFDKAAQFVADSESSIEIGAWKDRNRIQLQEYWARFKSDALELNKVIEGRIKELNDR